MDFYNINFISMTIERLLWIIVRELSEEILEKDTNSIAAI